MADIGREGTTPTWDDIDHAEEHSTEVLYTYTPIALLRERLDTVERTAKGVIDAWQNAPDQNYPEELLLALDRLWELLEPDDGDNRA